MSKFSKWSIVILIINFIGISFGVWCLFVNNYLVGSLNISAHLLLAGLVLLQDNSTSKEQDASEVALGERLLSFSDVAYKDTKLNQGSLLGDLQLYVKGMIFIMDDREFVLEFDDIKNVSKSGRFKLQVDNDVFVFNSVNVCSQVYDTLTEFVNRDKERL